MLGYTCGPGEPAAQCVSYTVSLPNGRVLQRSSAPVRLGSPGEPVSCYIDGMRFDGRRQVLTFAAVPGEPPMTPVVMDIQLLPPDAPTSR